MKHRWIESKWMPGYGCTTCRMHSHTKLDTECLAARHADPEINKLYRARRKAAEAADESGYKAMKGWADLERISAQLREIDPDGDWYYEGNLHDGEGWRVRRREVSA